jgi:hypothetical protein
MKSIHIFTCSMLCIVASAALATYELYWFAFATFLMASCVLIFAFLRATQEWLDS